jgi:hypothetical protein
MVRKKSTKKLKGSQNAEGIYLLGDRIFGKVKGYSKWPAKIISKSVKGKYNEFFGTCETAVLSKDSVYPFQENIEKFGQKTTQKVALKEAIQYLNF